MSGTWKMSQLGLLGHNFKWCGGAQISNDPSSPLTSHYFELWIWTDPCKVFQCVYP
jgi:hypothetical protein